MHNLLSKSQLDQWRSFESTLDASEVENQAINDYYECLIECDTLKQNECKRICRRILN